MPIHVQTKLITDKSKSFSHLQNEFSNIGNNAIFYFTFFIAVFQLQKVEQILIFKKIACI